MKGGRSAAALHDFNMAACIGRRWNLSRDAARAARVWRNTRSGGLQRQQREERRRAKEGRKRKVARSLHSLTSTPPFPLSFRLSLVTISSLFRPQQPRPAVRRSTSTDSGGRGNWPISFSDRCRRSHRTVSAWTNVVVRSSENWVSDNFPWSSLAGTNISTRSATNSRY